MFGYFRKATSGIFVFHPTAFRCFMQVIKLYNKTNIDFYFGGYGVILTLQKSGIQLASSVNTIFHEANLPYKHLTPPFAQFPVPTEQLPCDSSVITPDAYLFAITLGGIAGGAMFVPHVPIDKCLTLLKLDQFSKFKEEM